MDKKIIRFLWTSLVGLSVLCIGVFSLMTQIMIRENDDALSAVVSPLYGGHQYTGTASL